MTPRCLNRLQAAEYCSLTPTGFDDWVRRKIVPGVIPGTRKYDRKALDLALDARSKIAPESIAIDRQGAADSALQEWAAGDESNVERAA